MPTADAVTLLRALNETATAILTELRQARATQGSAAGPTVASDANLDGKYGNPTVTFDPRDWRGVTCKGLGFSECPPEFLDMLAETYDYFAGKAAAADERTSKGKPIADYKRKDAARARGWAARIRAGKGPSLAEEEPPW